MKKIFIYAVCALSSFVLALSCDKINGTEKTQERIDGLNARADAIAPVARQIEEMQASIDALYEVDKNVNTRISVAKTTADKMLTLMVSLRNEYEKHPYKLQGERIVSLEGKMPAVNERVAALETAEKNLKSQISAIEDNLKNYPTKDDMHSTFCTLEMQDSVAKAMEPLKTAFNKVESYFNSFQKELNVIRKQMEDGDEELRAKIDELDADLTAFKDEFTTDLEARIAEIETSVKAWISDTLTHYYTISALDVRVRAFEDDIDEALAEADENHRIEVENIKTQAFEYQNSLKQVRADLKSAYMTAIRETVDSFRVLIIANLDSITIVNGCAVRLENDLTQLTMTLDTLENDAKDLENQIQSISFVPGDNSGGAVAWFVGPKYKFEGKITLNYAVNSNKTDLFIAQSDVTLYYKPLTVLKSTTLNVLSLGEGDALSINNSTRQITVTLSVNTLKTLLGDQSSEASRGSCIGLCLAVKNGSSEVTSGFVDILAKDRTPEGALRGVFSVSNANKKVFLSKGNLQAEVDASGAASAWTFAPKQYKYIGVAVADTTIGRTAGTVDLFGWSTKENTKYGISASKEDADYSGEFRDWGWVYKKNLSPMVDWFTLASTEFDYLAHRQGKYGFASLVDAADTVRGLILLPDEDFVDPKCNLSSLASGSEFLAGNLSGETSTKWTENVYTVADWEGKMEPEGAAFLPSAGYRTENTVKEVGVNGYYWTSSTESASAVYARSEQISGSTPMSSAKLRSHGCSVRLVVEYKK